MHCRLSCSACEMAKRLQTAGWWLATTLSLHGMRTLGSQLPPPCLPQVRHQPPVGFLGLWPEFSLLNHSCTPNVALTVIKGTMLLHASDLLSEGQELSSSYLGRALMAPLQQRQQLLRDNYGFECGCSRCAGRWDCAAAVQAAGRCAAGCVPACMCRAVHSCSCE
jgi:hypothetical protein